MDSDFLLREIRKSKLTDASIQISHLKSLNRMIKIENFSFSGTEVKASSLTSIICIYKGKSAVLSLGKPSNNFQDSIMKVYRMAKFFGSKDSQSRFYSLKGKVVQKLVPYKSKGNTENSFIRAVKSAKKDRKIHAINSLLSESKISLSIANSYGAQGDLKLAAAALESEVIAKDGLDQGSGVEVSEAKDLTHINFESNLNTAILMAKSMLGARQAPTFYGKLLLDSRASIDFIKNIFTALNGEEILKKRSFLSKYKGKQIASAIFSLKEVPKIKNSMYNRKFDDELVPTTSKYFIQKGILKNYLNDIYSADKLKQKPLGNNFSLTFGGIRPSNCVLERGKGSVEDMVKEIDRGVYIINTGDSPNFSTGDVSAMVSIGYYVENGEIKFPLKETLVGGNMINMMKNIVRIGSDVRSLGGVCSPSILIENVKVSGK